MCFIFYQHSPSPNLALRGIFGLMIILMNDLKFGQNSGSVEQELGKADSTITYLVWEPVVGVVGVVS
jgi:hypothetical protein